MEPTVEAGLVGSEIHGFKTMKGLEEVGSWAKGGILCYCNVLKLEKHEVAGVGHLYRVHIPNAVLATVVLLQQLLCTLLRCI
ncbi:hypothetical protein L6452_04931 [Arctium lappa]|uniref:Uncharacterized protein n=1 Tax=Arctium lappa TaxID=4217 RepID=A0ACB9EEL2_ARCLA|nr:hypothetical protein L6452_04931 [Arctium lappa]